MRDKLTDEPSAAETGFLRVVATKTARKLKAQHDGPQGIWFGLGMSGLIGWSVAVPTLAGAFLGLWLDRHHPSSHSWTLALLVAGLTLGCLNAWHWLALQGKEMDSEPPTKDE
jgi:ATP synthase protein I